MGDPLECYSSAQEYVELMPPDVKVVYSGFNVGVRVPSGAALTHCAGEDNPCRQAYIDYVGYGELATS